MKRLLAFDFGASSGRAILADYENGTVSMREIHRFTNDPVFVSGTFYWDVLRLLHEIKQGMLKAKEAGGFDCVGIDTWGVDFGLLDKNGRLLENPVHYRDVRTKGMIEESEKYISKKAFYARTGIQFMEFNTAFQLLSLKQQRPELLERADALLFMPDLFSYFLTGKKVCEYSIATTSQLVDIETGDWSDDVIDALGLPRRILQPIVPTGTVIGTLSDEICAELGLPKAEVIAVAGHDTQSAITAVPTENKDFAFISCGTWSLFGTEPDAPIVTNVSETLNFTNEGGYDRATGFLKNICGLWLIQESRRQWKREGKDFSYADLEKFALSCEPFKCYIDPDDPAFATPGDLPGRVRAFCEKTGQFVPQTEGEVVRCIYESLALKYRQVLEGLQKCTGKTYPQINILGGGTKDTLLCRMTADSCGVPVVAGPIEATVWGNLALQLLALGELKSIREARAMIAEAEQLKFFEPSNTAAWDEAFRVYETLVSLH